MLIYNPQSINIQLKRRGVWPDNRVICLPPSPLVRCSQIAIGVDNLTRLNCFSLVGTERRVFESLDFRNVKTFIASGNVVFESDSSDSTSLTYIIEQKLKTQFGFDIAIMLRPLEDLKALVGADPFKGVASGSKTKLYVTFLAGKPEARLKPPYKHPDKNFTIVYLSDTESCSVLTLSPSTGTTDLMKFLEKQFGKNITTRNWNTIQKLLD